MGGHKMCGHEKITLIVDNVAMKALQNLASENSAVAILFPDFGKKDYCWSNDVQWYHGGIPFVEDALEKVGRGHFRLSYIWKDGDEFTIGDLPRMEALING